MAEQRKKNKVLGNSMLYTISSVLTKAVSFIMLPIYTNFISTEENGIVRVATNFLNVAVYIAALSLYSALVRFTSQYRHDAQKQRRLYGSVFLFVWMLSLIALGICLLGRNLLNRLVFNGIPFVPFVLVTLIALVFQCQMQIYISLLEGRQEGKKLLLLNAAGCLLKVCINLALMFVCKMGGISVLISTAAVDMMYMIVMLVDLKRRNLICFCLDWSILKETLRYSIPLVPHQLSSNIAVLASSVILKNKRSLSTVGLYSIASNFAVIIDTVQSSVNHAFMPWFFETMDDYKDKIAEARESIASFTTGLLLLYSVMYLGIGLFAQEFVLLFTEKSYALAWTPIPILVAGYSVKSIYYFYLDLLLYYKDPAKKLSLATITGSILNIVLSAYLAQPFGMYGVALSFLLSKIVVQVIVYAIARPFQKEAGYSVWKMAKPVLLSLLFTAVGLIFSYTKYQCVLSLPNFLYKVLIFALYLVIVYRSNPKQVQSVLKMGKNMLRRKTKKEA